MAVDSKLCDEKHHYMESIINHRFDAMDRALIERTRELEYRLESLNQLRKEVVADRGQFLKLDYYTLQHQVLVERLDGIRLWRAQMEGKASRAGLISIIAIITSSVFAIIHVFQSFAIK
jgi:hypothetical protein